MPEVVETRLVCACGDGKPAKRYLIDDGRRAFHVDLCNDHDSALRELMKLGEPAPKPKQRGSRGLSDNRLRQLIVED